MAEQETYQTRLRLTFEGDALDTHEIEVDVFASSLLSLSKLIRTSHSLTFDKNATCQFRLTSVTPNCVSVEFAITTGIGLFGAALFVATQVSWENAHLQLLKNLGFVKSKLPSLPTFFRALRKRKIVELEFVKLEDTDIVILHISDRTTLSLPYDIYKLIANPSVRASQYGLLKPLTQKGITTITYLSEINGDWVPATSISHEELTLFEPNVIEEPPVVEEFTIIGNLDRPSLHGDPKNWKIVEGKNTYTFDVTDEKFISLVRNNEIPFLGSDLFKVSMRSITPPPEDNKKTRYEGFNIKQMPHQKRLW